MKTWTSATAAEQHLTPLTGDELRAVSGGAIDGDVPQCGNVVPHFPYPGYTSLGSVVSLPAVQNTWSGR